MQDGDDLINHGESGLTLNPWKSFVYLGGFPQIDQPVNQRTAPLVENRVNLSEAVDPATLRTLMFPLAAAQVGDRVRIITLNCGESDNRLMAMGFMPGVILELVNCSATGSVIVALQDQRLGLGAEMAQQIQVIDGAISLENPAHSALVNSIPGAISPIIPLKLRDAAIGSRLKVMGYEPTARHYKRKLLAMGLTPGAEISVKRHAPLGDPTEIEVRGFRLSLRKDEADALMVESMEGVAS
ncbi:MAG: ferrous iron transport protein A [Oscillatoriales cyanobacterium RM1_1_9]|nr:ferrous iron transport protein A [Oscillatoriales cyanobacterium SM2_3_0]NJO46972.1 ferrous iron transport protein A [Oscillatoriales cyanobacterium RM2_1_1]NJO71709.1 ferrous iron transport protein A [Oscillatoriales cyanobacterium RM1_1_9]